MSDDRSTLKANGYRLRPLDHAMGRDLPDGTEIIAVRTYRDFKTYDVTRRSYYRTVLERRKTVGGLDEAIRSQPNADWPEIPPWQLGYVWLSPIPGYLEFCTAEKLDEWEAMT